MVRAGGRALLADAGRQEGAARAADRRPEGRASPATWCCAELSGRPPRVTRAGRCGARRPVRAAQLQPDRDPQAWPARTNSATRRSPRRKRVAKQPLGEREDLTHLPIVAIDPADARDHDDAIWAAPRRRRTTAAGTRSSPSPTSASTSAPARELDREARARGNSVYFPDRVVPMLPEELSADICSLKEGQDRAAMACHLHDRARTGRSKAGDSRARRFASPQTLPMRMRRRRSTQRARSGRSLLVALLDAGVEGTVPSELVDTALKPLVGLLAGLARGPQQARAARARPARAAGGARREGPDHCRSRRASGSTPTGWSRII